MATTRRTIGTTSTSVFSTSPDLSRPPASRLWRDVKYVTVRVMLWVSIFAPMITSAEYLYFRVLVPAMDSPRIPAPFVGPDIIVVQPTVAATHVETETIVPEPTTSGKHRAPEPEPTGTRSIAPAEPAPPVTTTAPPVTRTTTAPPVTTTTTPPVTTRTGSSRAAPESSAPVTSSPTPIYDTLRSETLATSPSLESVIPE